MIWRRKGKLFCEINPTCYEISLKKEIAKRHLKDFLGKEKFSKTFQSNPLPHVISRYSCKLIKKGKGIDPRLQENKAVNIRLACRKIHGVVIHPGEVFSFWRTIGKTTARKGYRDGRVIIGNRLIPGLGGGLCNLGNTIHWMVLHSPLTVTEFHHHSDALAPPGGGKHIPFSTGTSVSYNYVDYRFKNTTDQDVQLFVWCDEENLYGELRSEREFPWVYELVEEDEHFQKVGSRYFHNSRIYREVRDSKSEELMRKELVLNNHSEVMYDYDLIPKDQIREENKKEDIE